MAGLSGAWIEADVTNDRGAHNKCLVNLETGATISSARNAHIELDASGGRRIVDKSYDEIRTLLEASGLLLHAPGPQ